MYRFFPLLLFIIIGSSIGLFPHQFSSTIENFLYNTGMEAPLTPYTDSMLKFTPSSIVIRAKTKNNHSSIDLPINNLDLYEIKLPLLYLIDTHHLKLNSMGAERSLCMGISRHFKYDNLENLKIIYNQKSANTKEPIKETINIECPAL